MSWRRREHPSPLPARAGTPMAAIKINNPGGKHEERALEISPLWHYHQFPLFVVSHFISKLQIRLLRTLHNFINTSHALPASHPNLLFHLYSFTLSKLCTHTGTLVFLRIWTCKFFDCANRSTLFKLPYFSMMSDDFPPLGLSKPLPVPLPGRRQPQGKGRGAL